MFSSMMAYIPSPASNAIYIGPFPLRGYSMMILLGIAAAGIIGAMRYTTRTVVRDEIEDKPVTARYFWQRPGAEDMMDIVFWSVPFGILGARLYHIFTTPAGYFNPLNLGAIFRIWEGGLAIIGGIAGGALGAYICCRIKGIRFPVVIDALAPGLLVAQALGRWGNWFNQELFGGPTTLPWGLRISDSHMPINPATNMPYASGTLFHPTFLYESLWNLAMAGLLVLIDRRFRLGHGRVFFLYVYLYSLGRIWIEMIRTDPARVFAGLRLNAWSVMILGTLALIAFAVVSYLHPNREIDARKNRTSTTIADDSNNDDYAMIAM
ncbi:MAG: prolipoprotein diacylglyceryl transferase [Cellulomonadaceae bacterium]|jgi:prolipoprotein diacylglyceryl transferase|nr:prolipoprotein diacylglyceryl transferase [Cellulomonadaceae bacterium]